MNRVAGLLPVRPFNEALLGPFTQRAGISWTDLGVLLAWGAGWGGHRDLAVPLDSPGLTAPAGPPRPGRCQG